MSSPSSPTSTGVVNPNAMMLSAIWRICLAECVLALCGFGLIPLIEISWKLMPPSFALADLWTHLTVSIYAPS
jgi:hypothetical protein